MTMESDDDDVAAFEEAMQAAQFDYVVCIFCLRFVFLFVCVPFVQGYVLRKDIAS